MKTIVVAATKGGVGKTTLVSCLAAMASQESRVAILDWEPQGSLTIWWILRKRPTNPKLIQFKRDLRDEIDDLRRREEYDWAFVDTAPAGLEQIGAAIEAADFVIIPTQASVLDLHAVRPVVGLCQEQKKPFAFVLSRENTDRRGLNQSSVTTLRKLGPILEEKSEALTTTDRGAYVTAMNADGRTGPEHPDSKQRKAPKEEIEAIWAAIKRKLARGGKA